jgi:hypothetical protein
LPLKLKIPDSDPRKNGGTLSLLERKKDAGWDLHEFPAYNGIISSKVNNETFRSLKKSYRSKSAIQKASMVVKEDGICVTSFQKILCFGNSL